MRCLTARQPLARGFEQEAGCTVVLPAVEDDTKARAKIKDRAASMLLKRRKAVKVD
jgi:hypothetical protein